MRNLDSEKFKETSYIEPEKLYQKMSRNRNDPESPTLDLKRYFIDPRKKYWSSGFDWGKTFMRVNHFTGFNCCANLFSMPQGLYKKPCKNLENTWSTLFLSLQGKFL